MCLKHGLALSLAGADEHCAVVLWLWHCKTFGVAFVETYSTVQGDLTADYGASTRHVRLFEGHTLQGGRCCRLPLHAGTLGCTQGGLGSPYPGLAGTQSGRATRLGVEWVPWAKEPEGGA